MSSFTINRIILVGRLTKDPELRSLPSGTSVCSLRVACNSAVRDAEGDYHEKPNYFDVSVYRAHAENVHKYTRKGSRVGIDGRLQWREWETPDGQKHEAVSVVADTVQFLGGAGEPEGREPEGREPEGEWVGEEIDEKPGRELVGTGAHAGEKGSIF